MSAFEDSYREPHLTLAQRLSDHRSIHGGQACCQRYFAQSAVCILPCLIRLNPPALSQSLHGEISQFGLRSVCFEFGYFRTPFLQNTGTMQYPSRIADYKEMTDAANTRFAGTWLEQSVYGSYPDG